MIVPNVLLIGAEEKDAGKTTLSSRIVQKFSQAGTVYAVKITVLRGYDGAKGFSVWEENDPHRKKDTGRLLAAGAEKVIWLKTDEEHVSEGVESILKQLPREAPIVCESNAARFYIEPACFIMVRRDHPTGEKKSAMEVKHLVDLFVTSILKKDELLFQPDLVQSIDYVEGKWIIKGVVSD